jgi:phosphoenolpyruvate-protein phosphotransferase
VTTETTRPEKVLHGVAAAPGQAWGPLLAYRPAPPRPATTIAPGAAPAEQQRAAAAWIAAAAELEELAAGVRQSIGAGEAAIFEAQALMAADPTLSERAAEVIADHLLAADAAILAAAVEQAEVLEALDDPYLAERGADLRDVGARAARIARGEPPALDLARLPGPAIVVADDLSPSETARLDRARLLGIALRGGGPTSHVAVLARAMAVPLVCGLNALPDGGPEALLDGDAGMLVLNPDPPRMAAYQAGRAQRDEAGARQAALRDLPAETADGYRVRLVANAGSVADAQEAARVGAEGIGLLRTEFLFMDHEPGEEEQRTTYQAVFAALPGREVVVRTMDLGGDKPPAYIDFGHEANPFLGWRGLRMALDRPTMLQTQLRALLRAGAGRPVHLMFPMVSTLDEWRRARQMVDETAAELRAAGVAPPSLLEVGIMIEVPAAALMARAFAAEADFFSIGTNDLTQYTMAADRGAARVSRLYSAAQPAVLRLIAETVEAAHAAGRWVGMCGEAAGAPAWTRLWLGLGLDELSVAPAALAEVKEIIRGATLAEARQLAGAALRRNTLAEVEALLAT